MDNNQDFSKKDALEELAKSYPDFKPYYIDAIHSILQLSTDLEKSVEQHWASRHQFSRARYLILVILTYCKNKRMSPHMIAEKLCVTRGNMTGPIDSLIKDGLVTKHVDEKDRRQVWIQATPEASKFLKKALPDYFRRMAKFMSVLKKEEIEMFTKLAHKLNAGLEAFHED